MPFVGREQQVAYEDNPLSAFSRIIGQSPDDASAILKRKKSVLDAAISDVTAMQTALGAVEKAKLDQNLSALREVETSLSMGGTCNTASYNLEGFKNIATDYCPKTYWKNENHAVVGKLQTDLMVMALSCGMTRIASFMWSHPVSNSIVPGSNQQTHGASPWGTVRNSDGGIGLVMSGASVSETRKDRRVGASWYGDRLSINAGGGQSTENDYRAKYGNIGFNYEFNQRNSSVSVAYSGSQNEIAPVDPLQFDRIAQAERASNSFALGFSQVWNSSSVLQLLLTQTHHEGFLSDPYRLNDHRPDERNQTTIGMKWRQFFTDINGALQADYRLYHDSWGIASDTVWRPQSIINRATKMGGICLACGV